MATEAQALLEKLDRISEVEAAQKEALPRPFGSYVLLTSLARGGMGEVFLAKSGAVAGFEKHCVVKTLRPHLTDDREYVARFIDEARVVVQLNHKSVCQVFDVGMVGERYYLAMELIAGKDLRTLAEAAAGETDPPSGLPQPFDSGLAVHITGEVLEALDYAHRFVDVSGTPLRLVHRDVSPQNVMLSFEGEVKLIDFGLAASTVKLEQTSPNVVMGKLAYMSPEQIRGEKVDGRSDLFAAAVMLAELCTGERYYAGKTSYEIWSIASSGTFRPRRFSTIEPALRQILDKALSANADSRPASCLQLRQELMEWRQRQGLYADGPILRGVMQMTFAEDIRQHRELLAGVSAANLRPAPRAKEPTRSFARAGLPPVLDDDDPRTVTTLPSEHTSVLVRNLGGRQPPFKLAAAVAVVVIIALLVVVAVLVSRDAEPRVVVDLPVVNAPEPELALPVLAPVEALPVDVAAPATPEVVAPSPLESTANPPRRPKPKVSKVAETSRPAVGVTLSWSEMGIPQRVATLARTCKLACVDDVQRRFPSWGKGTPVEMKQFRGDVEDCHQRCQ